MSHAIAILRALPGEGCITTRAVAAATALDGATISKLVGRLVRRRFATVPRPGCYQITDLGRVARDAGATSLHPGKAARRGIPRRAKHRTIADRVWWLMRTERAATVADLLTLLDGGDHPAAHVRAFLNALFAAGYVAIDRRRRNFRFVLIKDTGPQTPLVDIRRRRLWDPNVNAFAPFGGKAAR